MKRAEATVQLASSLRDAGDSSEALTLLEGLTSAERLGAAPEAFKALALRDLGRSDGALAVALKAFAASLPIHGRAVIAYAQDLETSASGTS